MRLNDESAREGAWGTAMEKGRDRMCGLAIRGISEIGSGLKGVLVLAKMKRPW